MHHELPQGPTMIGNMNHSPRVWLVLIGFLGSCAGSSGLVEEAQIPIEGPVGEVDRAPESFDEEAHDPVLHVVDHHTDKCRLCSLYDMVAASTFVVRSKHGLGTAVLIAGGGLAVTNAHVVGDEEHPSIYQNDGHHIVAKVIRKDTVEDLALIEIPGLDEDRSPLALAIGKPRVGSEVYAVGHPLGLGWTISRGIVSGLPVLGERPMVQTDAPISSGNSGGPLVDEHGHVIGIVTQKIAGQGAEGLAFARPADVLARFLAEAGIEIERPKE